MTNSGSESFDARQPQDGEVLIQVHAAGINYADCVVRMGLYRSAREYVGLPITPGFEVCGRVIGVGDGVTSHQVGDPVIAVTRFDGYSSQITIDEAYVFGQPEAGQRKVRLALWQPISLQIMRCIISRIQNRENTYSLIQRREAWVVC